MTEKEAGMTEKEAGVVDPSIRRRLVAIAFLRGGAAIVFGVALTQRHGLRHRAHFEPVVLHLAHLVPREAGSLTGSCSCGAPA